MEEIQEVALSLALANEISLDSVLLNFTITEKQKIVVCLFLFVFCQTTTGFCFTVDWFGMS